MASVAPAPASHGVLFDVGYGLLDEAPRLAHALGWIAARLVTDAGPVSTERLAALYADACLAPAHRSLLVQAVLAAGADPDFAQRQRHLLPWDAVPMTALPGARAALERLRAGGLRPGVLANQPASARADLAREGLLPLLDGVWLSEEVGLAKPDPALFRLALDAWGLPPERVAYVGDRPDNDVAPARALGLFTVRLRVGPHAAQPALRPLDRAHADAASLAEVADRLLAWAAGHSPTP